MKLYEMLSGTLYTRGKLRDSHLYELLTGSYAVVALTTRSNELLESVPGLRYHHHPLADGRVDVLRAEAAVTAVLDEIARGRRVIVHCHAGRNRAGFVAALTVRQLTGISGADALEWVRRVRPNAVANPWFAAYLRRLPKL